MFNLESAAELYQGVAIERDVSRFCGAVPYDLFVPFLIVGQRVQRLELQSSLFVLEQEFNFLFYFT